MIAVYPFDEEELCYATAGYSLWYDASSSANLCDGAYTGVTVWLDGTTLANSTQIFSDAECTCATGGWYMDPVDTTTYYYLDNRTCNLTPGTCAAVEPPAELKFLFDRCITTDISDPAQIIISQTDWTANAGSAQPSISDNITVVEYPLSTYTYNSVTSNAADTTINTTGASCTAADPCNVATNLVVENEYTVDYIYPSSSGPVGGGGGAIGG